MPHLTGVVVFVSKNGKAGEGRGSDLMMGNGVKAGKGGKCGHADREVCPH